MRGFIAGIAATLVVGLIAVYMLLRSGLIPANADAKPGGLELWVASMSLDATLRRDAPKGPNPVALTDANLSEGIKLYGQHCALCHGTALDGIGGVGPSCFTCHLSAPQFRLRCSYCHALPPNGAIDLTGAPTPVNHAGVSDPAAFATAHWLLISYPQWNQLMRIAAAPQVVSVEAAPLYLCP